MDSQVIQISTGVSALWVLANICYAGMKAQGHPSRLWRVLSFLFGLPGTLLSLLMVKEGGENVYDIYLPKRRDTL
ncbi:MAG TPA: hypothetical protein VK596_05130 [Edaphobacter sp.]|nr:hypothetical protein [Edaphobacter sp.]